MVRAKRMVALAIGTGVLIAGCGGGSGGGGTAAEPTVPGGETLTVRAQDPRYAYDKKEYSAKAGTINIELVNDGKENHNIVVQGVATSKFKLSATPKESKVGGVTLRAGTFTIFCDITGHRQGGMEAKLVVS